jgi:hypothetical protein
LHRLRGHWHRPRLAYGNGGDGEPEPVVYAWSGAAGTIVVSVDPSAQQFMDRLHLSNKSGDGAPGAAPQIRVEAVPPLW